MLRLCTRYTSYILVAVVSAAMAAGVPAIAGNIIDADKLDGREGVGCDATTTKRAGAYVATCPSGPRAGLLPNNIIQRAPNSAKLGGRTPGDFDDAETLQGKEATAFASATHSHSGAAIASGTVSEARIDALIARDSEIMPKVLASDGAGSGLDADLLDGKQATAFAPKTHSHSGGAIASGTVAEARIHALIARDSEIMPKVLASDGTGSGLNADLLDGLSSGGFLRNRVPLNLEGDVPAPDRAVVRADNTGSGVGLWGSATSNAGVYGEATTGVGVWGRNNFGGIAMKAEGSAVQSAFQGGWAKALLRIQGDGTFVACYNGVTGASSGQCGFTVTSNGGGNYTIDFGSGIATQYRFFSLSGSSSIILTGYPGTTSVSINVGNATFGYAYYILVF